MILRVSLWLRLAHLSSCLIIVILSSTVLPLTVSLGDSLRNYETFLRGHVVVLPAVVGSAYGMLLLLSLLGIWAAAIASVKAFRLYSAAICFVFLGCVVYVIVTSILQMNFATSISAAIDYNMQRFAFHPEVMDNLQTELECCGKFSAEDWYTVTGYIPVSCCPEREAAAESSRCIVPEEMYLVPRVGCLEVLTELPKMYETVLLWFILATIFVQGVSLAVSFHMSRLVVQHEKQLMLLKTNLFDEKKMLDEA